jgi:arsenate reductase
MKKQRVLFLCTGNSCRSQMAEAIVNARLSDSWQAFSAGTRPAAAVHPLVPRVLAESGIAFKGEPKSAGRFRNTAFDLVVTLCDSARQECPVWPGAGKRLHQEYPDPGLAQATDEEKMAAFRRLRDSMLTKIPHLLEKNREGKMDS